MTDAVEGAAPGSEVMQRARSAFSQMRAAEEELRRAFPERGSEPDGLFGALCPRPEFRLWSRAPGVYRAHARELCVRAERRLDMAPGTDAECLLALSDMSLKAPLNATGTALYESLFKRVTGRAVEGEPAREPWPGAADELLHDMRRKLRDPSRR